MTAPMRFALGASAVGQDLESVPVEVTEHRAEIGGTDVRAFPRRDDVRPRCLDRCLMNLANLHLACGGQCNVHPGRDNFLAIGHRVQEEGPALRLTEG
jgi:hypothetical protein